MKVLLTGASGQLGWTLRQRVPAGVELIACSRAGGEGLLALDLADAQACRQVVLEHRPDWVLNSGAYTAVDRAESEQELVQAVNAGAPRAFAESLAKTGGQLLQLSTNYVFNGRQGRPYRPEQARDPLGVYGASKAAGEEAVETVLGGSGRGLVLRTSWLMGPVGRNFALTMLELHRERGRRGQPLKVVDDQVSGPTSTWTLAQACWRVVERAGASPGSLGPLLHWSDAGVASWYDVAVAIGELGVELGLLETLAAVEPISTDAFPTAAQRPPHAVLDCHHSWGQLELSPMPWRQALRQLLEQRARPG